jgi:hypothetical protein
VWFGQVPEFPSSSSSQTSDLTEIVTGKFASEADAGTKQPGLKAGPSDPEPCKNHNQTPSWVQSTAIWGKGQAREARTRLLAGGARVPGTIRGTQIQTSPWQGGKGEERHLNE